MMASRTLSIDLHTANSCRQSIPATDRISTIWRQRLMETFKQSHSDERSSQKTHSLTSHWRNAIISCSPLAVDAFLHEHHRTSKILHRQLVSMIYSYRKCRAQRSAFVMVIIDRKYKKLKVNVLASGNPIGDSMEVTHRSKRQQDPFEAQITNPIGLPSNNNQAFETETAAPHHPAPIPEPEGTPSDAPQLHPMDCMDMIIGSAVGTLSRIEDYWSVSRATPNRDQYFGGKQSITSSGGWEVDGVTTIVFRRKLTGNSLCVFLS
jgi:hypothetical protein